TCTSPSGITAANTVRTLGPVTTTSLVVGAAGVLASGIWLGVRPSPKYPLHEPRPSAGRQTGAHSRA
ncbi:MAG: hypothetical protein ACLP1X_02235, partial [Polyangiaceae bacterium]